MNRRVRVLLIGAGGRMGTAVLAAADSTEGIVIAGTASRGDSPRPAVETCDVVIDFSHADATADLCSACVRELKPLVTGTTGHSAAQRKFLERAAEKIAIVHAANFSIGVNVLFSLTRTAAQLLGEKFDLEIVEAHHRWKKDSPSGTAKRLAEILCDVRGGRYDTDVAHGREGLSEERAAAQIGMHSIRGGDVVGDHTVIFAGSGERIELTHRASNRATFALGALRAAQWVVDQPAGLYNMEDVLGLTNGK
ncbi:MAG: 4-hydroxy-tetrahydrodipicolinate reductase [Verrucomicrobiota bacterium]|nr:4-hydroxy-tetrahydrodipicolinate reductase [Verrucomicrobiota bacterium]